MHFNTIIYCVIHQSHLHQLFTESSFWIQFPIAIYTNIRDNFSFELCCSLMKSLVLIFFLKEPPASERKNFQIFIDQAFLHCPPNIALPWVRGRFWAFIGFFHHWTQDCVLTWTCFNCCFTVFLFFHSPRRNLHFLNFNLANIAVEIKFQLFMFIRTR